MNEQSLSDIFVICCCHEHYNQAGTMLGFTLNGVPYFYVRNLQGDVSAVIDANGQVVARYAYDAWGNLLSYSGELARVNPVTYRGYYFDWATGLFYLQSRYYCPVLRRFISADVYLDTNQGVLGTNMYAYCLNDPVNRVDPDGFRSVRTRGTFFLDTPNAWQQHFDALDHSHFVARLYLRSMGFDSFDVRRTLQIEAIGNQFAVMHGRATFETEGREWTFEFKFGMLSNVRELEAYLFRTDLERDQLQGRDHATLMSKALPFGGKNNNSSHFLMEAAIAPLQDMTRAQSFLREVLNVIPTGITLMENRHIFIPIRNINSRPIR